MLTVAKRELKRELFSQMQANSSRFIANKIFAVGWNFVQLNGAITFFQSISNFRDTAGFRV